MFQNLFIQLLVIYTIIKNKINFCILFFLTLFGYYEKQNEYEFRVQFDDYFSPSASYFLLRNKHKNSSFKTWLYYYYFFHHYKVVKINNQIYDKGKINGKTVPFDNIYFHFKN